MKKKNVATPAVVALLFGALLVSACSQNQKARRFGGKEEIALKPNEKLLNMTWKESSLWLLTEDTLTHIKYFRERSNWGVWEGEISVK